MADARAFLRETPTPVLLADLADDGAPRKVPGLSGDPDRGHVRGDPVRADLAQPIPPVWWMDAVIQAGRIRAVLRERGIPTVNSPDVRHGESAR